MVTVSNENLVLSGLTEWVSNEVTGPDVIILPESRLDEPHQDDALPITT